jgi:methylamine dehydrogenase accessory protein MauD
MSALFWASFALLWLVVLFQGAVLIEVVRRLAGVRSAGAPDTIGADPLPTGSPAPAFEAPLVDNRSLVRSQSLGGRRVLLAFISAGCASCDETFDLTLAAARHLDAQTILICRGPRDECRQFARRHLPSGTAVWDVDGKIGMSFRVHSTPLSVALDEQWRVIKYGAPLAAEDLPSSLTVVPPAADGVATAAR